MATQYKKAAVPGGPEKENQTAKGQAGAGGEEACRCKEASEMRPRQLLRLMISDLAFWKKAKK